MDNLTFFRHLDFLQNEADVFFPCKAVVQGLQEENSNLLKPGAVHLSLLMSSTIGKREIKRCLSQGLSLLNSFYSN